MPFLMNYIEFELYDSCQDVMTVFKSFETLNITMLNPQPEIRPTASELLRDFYQLFSRFKHTNMDPIILSLKSILAIQKEQGDIKMEEPTVAPDSKVLERCKKISTLTAVMENESFVPQTNTNQK